jgi:hypothetical protein
MLGKHDDGTSKRVYAFTTSDESYWYYFDSEAKRQSLVLKTGNDPPQKNFTDNILLVKTCLQFFLENFDFSNSHRKKVFCFLNSIFFKCSN